MLKEKRKCLECEEAIFGRADKKFCCDHCRNAYNNRNNSDASKLVRNINYALRKNRRILAELNESKMTKLGRSRLIMRGFSFQYFTHTYETQSGTVYFFCYEMGYLPLDEEAVLIVRQDQ